MATLDLISRVYLALSVKMLPEQLKYSTFSGSFSSVTICTADGWLPSGSHYLHLFQRRLGGTQSQSENFKKDVLLLPGIELRFLYCAASIVITIPTELSRLLII